MHRSKVSFVAIVVSAAFLFVLNRHAEGNKFEDREVGKVKEAKFLAVEFKEGVLPPMPVGEKLTTEAFPAYIMSISGVSVATDKGIPSLIYFSAEAWEILPDKIKKLNLKQPVRRCAKLEEKSFVGKNVAIGTMAKLFFCVKIDITGVIPGENHIFNVLRAPLVLIVPSDGSVIRFLSGNKLNESKIESEMTRILQRNKIDISKVFKDTEKILLRIQSFEASKRELRRDRRKVKIKLKDPDVIKKRSMVAEYEKEQRRLQGETKKNKKELADTYEEFNEILRKASSVELSQD